MAGLPLRSDVGLDEGVSETPLYDATLSATLARLRIEAGAQASTELQGQVAAAREQAVQAREVAERADADRRRALETAALARQEAEQAQAELARIRREAEVRAALRETEVEELVRSGLVHAAAPLVELTPAETRPVRPDPDADDADDADDGGPVAPPVPSFADLRTPAHRVDAFFDALLGP